MVYRVTLQEQTICIVIIASQWLLVASLCRNITALVVILCIKSRGCLLKSLGESQSIITREAHLSDVMKRFIFTISNKTFIDVFAWQEREINHWLDTGSWAGVKPPARFCYCPPPPSRKRASMCGCNRRGRRPGATLTAINQMTPVAKHTHIPPNSNVRLGHLLQFTTNQQLAAYNPYQDCEGGRTQTTLCAPSSYTHIHTLSTRGSLQRASNVYVQWCSCGKW